MTLSEIIKYRLVNQQIARRAFKKPAEAVAWMGAIQAQDYGAAKWALGQRVNSADDATIEQAFTNGAILRTHLMRPTWHFVAPADIRWLLGLTAPRVKAQCAHAYRLFGLDDAIFKKSNNTLTKALSGNKQLTRAALVTALQKAKVNTDDLRFTHLMMRAELDGIVCSGGRQGKQFTYALLDERAPNATVLKHEEALAELTKRYFTSHGPATLADFVWWSGLTMAMAKKGVEMCGALLLSEIVNRQTYWFSGSLPSIKNIKQEVYLLPNYDEYIVGYKDRSVLMPPAHNKKTDSRGNVLFNNVIVIDGRVAGTWKRTIKKNSVVVEATSFTAFNKSQANAVAAATERYKHFMSGQL